jgi:hypothetical protein
MAADRRPWWSKRWDAINFSIVAVIIIFVLWDTFASR